MKKIAVLNDLSGLGKCSLTAAIPVISVMGIQACPLPTAVLSCQTGFPSYFCDDYTDRMDKFMDEWKNLDFSPIEKKNYPENKRREVRGIYVTSSSASLTKRVDDLIALSKRTKINAFVIDVKEDDGTLLFKMKAGEKYNPNANRTKFE